MKTYNDAHGFVYKKAEYIEELNATLVTYEHTKTAMPLLFSDREDTNKTFAIGFRTVPTDDTGIFHILEHSVLSGSEKFPVKDPFTQLLKSSVSTYLNALTYPDRTVYPVSSKNSKAFFDLMDVYLDSVFHPLALKNKNIFLCEGHRLELDSEGTPTVNGVVYNEMRGAYASIDEYSTYKTDQLLYPGGCYGFDSGGHPDSITSLTYEDFCSAHKEFYHPSNAFIFIDGSVDIEKCMELIDSYLSEYSRSKTYDSIPLGEKVNTSPTVGYHPQIPNGKCDIYLGMRYDKLDRDKLFALSVLEEMLAGSNSAILKKNILSSGLCENFYFYLCAGLKYPAVRIRFVNVEVGKEDAAVALFRSELEKLISDGLDISALKATLNAIEFRARESDYGSFPKGMVIMTSATEALVQGEEPSSGLYYLSTFEKARKMLGTSYYSDILKELLCSDSIRFTVYSGEQSSSEHSLPRLSKEDVQVIAKENAELARWQNTPDTQEALDSIPKLMISDLEKNFTKTPTEQIDILDVKTLFHPLKTEGISYAEIYFDISDTDPGIIPSLPLLTSSYSDFDTESRKCEDFDKDVKMHLGSLSSSLTAINSKYGPKLYFTVKFACLDTEKENAVRLFSEYLYSKKYNTPGAIERKITQISARAENLLAENGHAIALSRTAAKNSVADAIKEMTAGFTFLKNVKMLSEHKEQAEKLSDTFDDIRKSCFTRSRAICAITGNTDTDFATQLIKAISEGGSLPSECKVKRLEGGNEGIVINSPVGFSVFTVNYKNTLGKEYTGALATLSSMMTYEILWEQIRIKGGAYDTEMLTDVNNGNVAYFSYRDPSVCESAAFFKDAAQHILDFIKTDPPLDQYIVGAYGAYDTVTTPRAEGSSETVYYLSGTAFEDRLKRREQTIGTTKEELVELSNMLDSIAKDGTTVICADEQTLKKCDTLHKLLRL